jgi:hypothetical protein
LEEKIFLGFSNNANSKSIMMKNSCERFEFKHIIIAYSLLECQALQPELKIANPHPA